MGALLVAACTAQADPSQQDGSLSTQAQVSQDDDWLLVMSGDPAYSLTALLVGELEIDLENRCVGVVPSGTQTSVPVIFPDGTILDRSDADAPAVVLRDGRRLLTGTRVEIPGLYVAATKDFSFPEYDHITVPEACSTEGVWISGDMKLLDLIE